MAKGKNQHVVKHSDGWAVKGAGNSKATKVTHTQAQAIEKAENIAFGVKMLKAAKKNVVYIPEPLLLDRQEQEPLTLDPQLKAEYQLIMR